MLHYKYNPINPVILCFDVQLMQKCQGANISDGKMQIS
uniref:Uncharacterized protein n=1 Tax=Anguilla anguilla TaxID=7936 RepID=A0A0E9SMT5_ANGAN